MPEEAVAAIWTPRDLERLARTYWRFLSRCPNPELWLRPNDGHVSILDACPLAMDWLKARHHVVGETPSPRRDAVEGLEPAFR